MVIEGITEEVQAVVPDQITSSVGLEEPPMEAEKAEVISSEIDTTPTEAELAEVALEFD